MNLSKVPRRKTSFNFQFCSAHKKPIMKFENLQKKNIKKYLSRKQKYSLLDCKKNEETKKDKKIEGLSKRKLNKSGSNEEWQS